MTKREISNLKQLAKKILPKDLRVKIYRIKDRDEKKKLYKHAIKSNLDIRMHRVDMDLKKHKEKHDVFHLIAKANLLNLKIKYFVIEHDKKDLKKILKELKKVEKELEEFN